MRGSPAGDALLRRKGDKNVLREKEGEGSGGI